MLSATVATLGFRSRKDIGRNRVGALRRWRDGYGKPRMGQLAIAVKSDRWLAWRSRRWVETSCFEARIWREASRRARFWRECRSIARLILLVLTPAFAAEFLLNAWLDPNVVAAYVGQDSAFAVPIAVFVGGPAYIDGYAALPLTRALLANGMSSGAAISWCRAALSAFGARWRFSRF